MRLDGNLISKLVPKLPPLLVVSASLQGLFLLAMRVNPPLCVGASLLLRSFVVLSKHHEKSPTLHLDWIVVAASVHALFLQQFPLFFSLSLLCDLVALYLTTRHLSPTPLAAPRHLDLQDLSNAKRFFDLEGNVSVSALAQKYKAFIDRHVQPTFLRTQDKTLREGFEAFLTLWRSLDAQSVFSK